MSEIIDAAEIAGSISRYSAFGYDSGSETALLVAVEVADDVDAEDDVEVDDTFDITVENK